MYRTTIIDNDKISGKIQSKDKISNYVSGKELKCGDKIKVIYACNGALGANEKTGVVVEQVPPYAIINGFCEYEDGVVIRIDSNNNAHKFWKVGLNGKYEILKRANNKKYIELDVLIDDKKTKVITKDSVGVARCKQGDRFIEAYGIIIAIANAYNISKEKRAALVDALYNDVKSLKDYSSEELLNELKKRI